MTSNESPAASNARDDWELVAQLVTMRFPSRAPEAQRLARIREIVTRMNELSVALARFAERASALCETPRAVLSIDPETAALDEATSRYAASVAAVASEFRAVVRGSCDPCRR